MPTNYRKEFPVSNGRAWTEEEDKYLETWFHRTTTKRIAAKMNRSFPSIYGRAYMLGLTKSSSYYTAEEVAVIFGVEPSTVRNWIRQGIMPGYRPPYQEKRGLVSLRRNLASIEDIMAFIVIHCGKYYRTDEIRDPKLRELAQLAQMIRRENAVIPDDSISVSDRNTLPDTSFKPIEQEWIVSR